MKKRTAPFNTFLCAVLFVCGLLSFDSIVLSAVGTIQTTTDCPDVNGKKCVYKLWTTGGAVRCGGGSCPTNHYCPDGYYPGIMTGLAPAIVTVKVRKDLICGAGECTPRCGWPDVDHYEKITWRTCNGSQEEYYSPNGGEAYCLCTRLTCTVYPNQCGTFSDGCSGDGTIDCGCPSGDVCDNGTCCTPKTCAVNYPGQCGVKTDDCGGTIDCGPCPQYYFMDRGHSPSVGSPPYPANNCYCDTTPDNIDCPTTATDCISNAPNPCEIVDFEEVTGVYSEVYKGVLGQGGLVCEDAFKISGNRTRYASYQEVGMSSLYTEVMKVNCPGEGEVGIAGIEDGASKLKIRKDSKTYGVVLVDHDDTNASCVRVNIPGAINNPRALRKM